MFSHLHGCLKVFHFEIAKNSADFGLLELKMQISSENNRIYERARSEFFFRPTETYKYPKTD